MSTSYCAALRGSGLAVRTNLSRPGSSYHARSRKSRASSQAVDPGCRFRRHRRPCGLCNQLCDQSRRSPGRPTACRGASCRAASTGPDRGRRAVHPRALADPRRRPAKHGADEPRADLLPDAGPGPSRTRDQGQRRPSRRTGRPRSGSARWSRRGPCVASTRSTSRRSASSRSPPLKCSRCSPTGGTTTCTPRTRRARREATRSERSAESSGRTSSRRTRRGYGADHELSNDTQAPCSEI